MSFNGSGVFQRLYNWVNDAAASIKIRADRMDAEFDGIATGLTTCITKDGQTTITANLPMATYRHTNVGNAANRTDYAAAGQVQDGKLNWVDGGGTADAITATYAIPITALVDGQLCFVRATAANATTTPTFSPSGLTARTIVKEGGQALVAGDIRGDGHELILRYDLANTRWELMNPKGFQLSNDIIANSNLANMANNTIKARVTSGTGDPEDATLTQVLDMVGSAAQGDILYRNASAWTRLGAGTAGQVLKTGGAGADPSWGVGGRLVQRVPASVNTMTSGTAQIPVDDTIPQSGEGLEAITCTITPTSATNRLIIWFQVNVANAGSNQTFTAALFQDSTANALHCACAFEAAGNNVVTITGIYEMDAGTTSATTFKVRAAGDSSTTVTLNGASGARLFGGVLAHKMTIFEVAV